MKVGINATHGLSGSPTYITWQNMKNRCFKLSHKDYARYGARGIKVCRRWMRFENFYKDMGIRPKDKTLDRINNDGNYSPSNCRWSSINKQARNRSNNRRITWNGKTLCLREWSDLTGIPASAILARLDSYGWTVERALTASSSRTRRNTNRLITFGGKTRTITEWCRHLGARSRGTIDMRLKSGWTLEMALTTPVGRK